MQEKNIADKIALSVSEAAELLSVSKPTLYQLIKTDGFPAFYIGKRTLVSRRGLEDWVSKQVPQCEAWR